MEKKVEYESIVEGGVGVGISLCGLLSASVSVRWLCDPPLNVSQLLEVFSSPGQDEEGNEKQREIHLDDCNPGHQLWPRFTDQIALPWQAQRSSAALRELFRVRHRIRQPRYPEGDDALQIEVLQDINGSDGEGQDPVRVLLEDD